MFDIQKTDIFDKWLGGVKDIRLKAAVQSRIYRLKAGLFGDVKPAGEGVSELRIHYGSGYRIYFTQRGKGIIILLAGGDKSTQDKDIKKAVELAREV